jgi:hypothetical protein
MEVSNEVLNKPKNKQYFTKDTEDAIILYNKTEDPEKRNKIYRERIHYAFYKLAENLIHTFKFYHTEVESLEDLKHEIISLLVRDKIHKFNPDLGAKAYSYFGTIVKNWLIIYNQKNYKKKIDTVDIDVLEENEEYSYNIEEIPYKEKLSQFMDLYIEYCTKNIFELFPKDDEAKVADAILELFRKRENLDIFNKKALYIYIREIIDVKTPKITKVANQLNNIFKTNYLFYLDNGYTNF